MSVVFSFSFSFSFSFLFFFRRIFVEQNFFLKTFSFTFWKFRVDPRTNVSVKAVQQQRGQKQAPNFLGERFLQRPETCGSVWTGHQEVEIHVVPRHRQCNEFILIQCHPNASKRDIHLGYENGDDEKGYIISV